ncbi:hypothetical protein RB195_003893 [Necator americanus]|uniref:Uncharacterized protein n=1 Tax=Necator americanus TaxID=51031 RepID=A0ABR1DQP4_NECAM
MWSPRIRAVGAASYSPMPAAPIRSESIALQYSKVDNPHMKHMTKAIWQRRFSEADRSRKRVEWGYFSSSNENLSSTFLLFAKKGNYIPDIRKARAISAVRITGR